MVCSKASALKLQTWIPRVQAHAKHMIDNKWVDVKRHDNDAHSAGPAIASVTKCNSLIYQRSLGVVNS